MIVTSDGDFGCLVRYLYRQEKLERVLSPNHRNCSALLKRAARERIDFLESVSAAPSRDDLSGPPSRSLRADGEPDVAVEGLQKREHLVDRFAIVRLIEQAVELRRRGPQAPDKLPP